MSSIGGELDLETLGGRVAFMRGLKGWYQADLALAAGFSQPTISTLEGGQIKEPTARLIAAVARALETTFDYLWSNEGGADESMLLASFRKLSDGERMAVLRAAGVSQEMIDQAGLPKTQ